MQHFNFVLTDIDSKWTFGYVRHGTRSETALVVLSSLPWHESFHKFLNVLSDLIESPNSSQVWQMLQTVFETQPPDPGGTLTVNYNDGQEKVLPKNIIPISINVSLSVGIRLQVSRPVPASKHSRKCNWVNFYYKLSP